MKKTDDTIVIRDNRGQALCYITEAGIMGIRGSKRVEPDSTPGRREAPYTLSLGVDRHIYICMRYISNKTGRPVSSILHDLVIEYLERQREEFSYLKNYMRRPKTP